MIILEYEPTYTNYSTLDKVPEEVIKQFCVEDESKVLNLLPKEVVERVIEIKQQRVQAIKMREYFEKQPVEKSSFI